MAEARPSKLLLSTFVTVVVLAASIVIVVLVVRSRTNDNQGGLNAALGSAASLDDLLAAPAPSIAARDLGSRGVILDRAGLKDAIAVARPRMENTVTRVDVGAALLAIWASKKLTWNALTDLPETSPLMFRKDPDAERGKRLCMSGRIDSIRAEKTLAGRLLEDRTLPLIERSPGPPAKTPVPMAASPAAQAPTAPGPASTESVAPPPSRVQLEGLSIPDEDWTIPDDGKVFFVTLEEKPEEAKPGESVLSHAASLAKKGELLSIEVIAVGSTRGLVDGSDARACGVLTGVTLPYLSTGGASDIPQHRIVGMFDLPENRSEQRGETR
jgi:hypothetical protein